MWFGCDGLKSLLHYDASHNFFSQVYGRKTVALLSPQYGEAVQLYPWVHPGDAHTQLDLENLNADTHGDFLTAQAIVADLGPGDTL